MSHSGRCDAMNMESLAGSTGTSSNVETLPSGSTSTISKRMSKIYVLNSNRDTLVLKSEDSGTSSSLITV